jgi:hypothetical protein
MKNYDQIQEQLADLSDMIAQVHQQDLQAHHDRLKKAEQSDKERLLIHTVSRATGMIESIVKDHVSNKNYMEACTQLDNLIWLHKELPLGTISEKWVKEFTEQKDEVMKTAVYTSGK